MSEQPGKSIQVTNYDKIKAMARNETVIKSFAQTLGNSRLAMSYITSALLAVANNKDLMECEPASIWSTALRAASLRLSCDPALGQAYPVPYKGKATLQIGFRGIEQMALRTNQYRYINTGEIYEGQIIEVNQLTGAAQIRGQRASDQVLGYFCYFELFNGFSHALYMTVDEIKAHAERYSQTYRFSTSKWHSEFPKMAKKTVLRQNLLRYGFLTAEDRAILTAIGEEEQAAADVIDTTFEDIRIEAEPEAERRPAGDILDDLGYQGEAAAKPAPRPSSSQMNNSVDATHSPQEAPQRTPAVNPTKDAAPAEEQPMTLEEARNMTSSDNVRYGDTEKVVLREMRKRIEAKLKKTDLPAEEAQLYRRKIKAIGLILG
jgi:recombination protein RecT